MPTQNNHKKEVEINKIRGKLILTPILAAISSAL